MTSNLTEKIQLFFNKPPIRWGLLFVTFAIVFIYHTYPLGLSDFWWHLNTGRWIWEHNTLPTDDPFLFTSVAPLSDAANQILGGYPLSQLLYFASYTLAGISALLVLKGLLMTLFYGLLWNQLRSNGLNRVLALAIVAPLPMLFFRFDDLRPQMFTFIFTLLVMQLAEYHLAQARRQATPKLHELCYLPITMLLWANLHGGFIIGIGILSIHLLAEGLARKSAVHALSKLAYRRLTIITLVSIASTALNPAGITATWASFAVVSGPFSKVIDEFLWTPAYFQFHGIGYMGYTVMATAILPLLAILSKWRKVSLAHWLMLACFLAAGTRSFRFSLLMVAAVIAIASLYLARDLNRWLNQKSGITILLLWCISTGLLANAAIQRTALMTSPIEASVIPSSAVDYLKRAAPTGNIYNFYEYGGYLSWRLYPVKIFIDQRCLSWDTYEAYSQVWRGDYTQIFQKYRIGSVIYPVFEDASGKPSRIVVHLLNDKQWGVGYYDGRNIVLIKSGMNSHLPMLNKQKVIANLAKKLHG